MAEYINRAKVDYEFMTTRGGGDIVVELYERILDIPDADVVERDEYEMMAERCKAMTTAFTELQKDNKDLRSKIDEVIEEIPSLSHWQSSDGQDLVMVSDIIELIKRSIGE